MQNLWIFQLDKNLVGPQAEALMAHVEDALRDWKTHGKPVPKRLAVLHGRFVVVNALDDASGCSVDWLTRQVEGAIAKVGASVEDHSRICYRTESCVESLHFTELIARVRDGRLSMSTVIFDNTIVHGGTISDWEKPVSDSWLAPRITALA